jgi:branched-chain amino acid transport system substrate-binding protein
VLFDDESVPDKAAALYERLITEEEVDLLIGPYGTGNITAAMNVAERYGYVFPHHTGSLTYAYTYDKHFPMWYTVTPQSLPPLICSLMPWKGAVIRPRP